MVAFVLVELVDVAMEAFPAVVEGIDLVVFVVQLEAFLADRLVDILAVVVAFVLVELDVVGIHH